MTEIEREKDIEKETDREKERDREREKETETERGSERALIEKDGDGDKMKIYMYRNAMLLLDTGQKQIKCVTGRERDRETDRETDRQRVAEAER